MKNLIKTHFPGPLLNIVKIIYYTYKTTKYKLFGRPITQLETAKAKPRRIREGFYDKFCIGDGFDIGYGGDILSPNCRGWDVEDGDAQFLNGIDDESFDFVYSGHTLEHMVDAEIALKNWWRVVKPDGYLIIYIPHRDLFERKKTLPSRWNDDHKHFFLLDEDEPPDTIGILPLIQRSLSNNSIEYAKICDEGYLIPSPEEQGSGEYSIEVILKKSLLSD